MDRLTTTMAVSAGDSGRFHVDVHFPDPKPECLGGAQIERTIQLLRQDHRRAAKIDEYESLAGLASFRNEFYLCVDAVAIQNERYGS
jgi:hypothetical protein